MGGGNYDNDDGDDGVNDDDDNDGVDGGDYNLVALMNSRKCQIHAS